MPTTITLFRQTGLWLARWSGDGADEIERVFRSRVLPTAFEATMDGETVRAKIAVLNPACVVELA